MLQELLTFQTLIREAKELISGMSVAVDRACKNTQRAEQEFDISRSDDIEKTYLPLHKFD